MDFENTFSLNRNGLVDLFLSLILLIISYPRMAIFQIRANNWVSMTVHLTPATSSLIIIFLFHVDQICRFGRFLRQELFHMVQVLASYVAVTVVAPK